jgi:hypothetical protein
MLKSLENECPELFPREVQELLHQELYILFVGWETCLVKHEYLYLRLLNPFARDFFHENLVSVDIIL